MPEVEYFNFVVEQFGNIDTIRFVKLDHFFQESVPFINLTLGVSQLEALEFKDFIEDFGVLVVNDVILVHFVTSSQKRRYAPKNLLCSVHDNHVHFYFLFLLIKNESEGVVNFFRKSMLGYKG